MDKKPLYRKENKLALHFDKSGKPGGDFRHIRNTKKLAIHQQQEISHLTIGHTNIGYDYTPLFKFLLSKVGQPWDAVFSEAVSRLDKQEPIFWMVKVAPDEKDGPIFRVGEATYYSTLVVKNGMLEKMDPSALLEGARCSCHTHSFNGKVVKYKERL